jgi:N6-L-threonylcarbamoyladenine synthase
LYVLGVESSCDETAASIVGPEGVLSDVVYSQAVHAEYGGVVPELAARAHVEKLATVVRAALAKANLERPDGVAATAGPGLIGAVLVGLASAKGLAAGWRVPFVGVNHLEGHMLSPLLEDPAPEWPFLALVVSGGHTTLYLCRGLADYDVLAETVDDAAGEAFDKVARMLGLGYPGGPVVDRLAQQGDPAAVDFPRPKPGGRNWSFSGLKTAVRNHILSKNCVSDPDVCASFQRAVVDCLVSRVELAVKETGIRRVALSGGVAANGELRRTLTEHPDLDVFIPPRSRCTDNGAMIANAGRMRLMAGIEDDLDLLARSSWAVT